MVLLFLASSNIFIFKGTDPLLTFEFYFVVVFISLLRFSLVSPFFHMNSPAFDVIYFYSCAIFSDHRQIIEPTSRPNRKQIGLL